MQTVWTVNVKSCELQQSGTPLSEYWHSQWFAMEKNGKSPWASSPCNSALSPKSYLHRLQLISRIKCIPEGVSCLQLDRWQLGTGETGSCFPTAAAECVSTFSRFPIPWDLQGTSQRASALLYPLITPPEVHYLQTTQHSAKRLYKRLLPVWPSTREELNLNPGLEDKLRPSMGQPAQGSPAQPRPSCPSLLLQTCLLVSRLLTLAAVLRTHTAFSINTANFNKLGLRSNQKLYFIVIFCNAKKNYFLTGLKQDFWKTV